MKRLLLIIFVIPFFGIAQKDSAFVRSIYNEALSNGESYENLRSLCKDIGARVTGSAEAEMAIEWGEKLLEKYQFDNVYLQEIEVPHWERGTKEACWAVSESGDIQKLNVSALGMSVGTNGLISGEVVSFSSMKELERYRRDLTGKIVFINQPFNEQYINTMEAYSGCWPVRWSGTSLAASKGAIACVIRSLASSDDDFPHTGTMVYKDDEKKIAGVALSTNHSNWLAEELKKGKVILKLETDCRRYPDKKSYNVIGELFGVKRNSFITVGGHLDSWDLGEGAHDDGAGVVHSIEALRILKSLGYQPENTLRVVLFMNEENGNKGGKTYASWVKERNEEHLFAIESDAGGFSPRGFSIETDGTTLHRIKRLRSILEPYGLHYFEEGHAGVDIGPLKDYYPNITMLGLRPDSQRYFDVHHSSNDVFENVNKRELELGSASIASMIYLLDQFNVRRKEVLKKVTIPSKLEIKE